MEIIFLLIPLAMLLVGAIAWAFWWAVKSGQFDDLEGPAHRILMDKEHKVNPKEGFSSAQSGTRKKRSS
jgi:cbb3-type cytochrome oxidase maturation protein